MLDRLCTRHWEVPRSQLDRLDAEVCPMCLLEEVGAAKKLVERAAEKIRRLEWVRDAAQRFRSDPRASPDELDEALRTSTKRAATPGA